MWRYVFFVVLGIACAVRADDSGQKPNETSVPRIRPALVQALRTNIDYCRDWAAAGDVKSLRQGLHGALILVRALGRHTIEEDNAEIEAVSTAIAATWIISENESSAATKQRLRELDKLIAACVAGKMREQPKSIGKNANGFKPLMALIDGTYADGKTALATGDPAAAKANALVLAELGEWLIAERTDDRWREHARGMQTAAREAAQSTSDDEKTLRPQFRAIYTHCERCHDKR